MPKYGFLIDNRRCIGCHACTVACKQEHEVPLGSFRTWVKYVESGAFPDTRRHFSVMRCNHCENPPCVTICPVTALYQRDDGIVDFDPEVCIGCKSCMQACPYDALYINDDTGAANKCNFCAHRIEAGREPPCVTVCPEQAIVMGDLDDPESRISRLIDSEPTTVRAPEKGTRPKLYYIDGKPASLDPLQAPPRSSYVWSQASTPPPELTYTPQELQALATRTYDVGHSRPWGWRVSAYLTTKSIAAGAFLVPALAWLTGAEPASKDLVQAGAAMGLLFLTLTAVLLVWDLKRPAKFLSLMLRPQRKSWLVLGSFVLTAYGVVLAAYLASGFLERCGLNLRIMQAALVLQGIPLAFFTACYTAWLFRQCAARDLWHSRLLPWHLALQAVLAGAAVTLLLPMPSPEPFLRSVLGAALAADLVFFLPSEFLRTSGHTRAYRQAAALLTRGAMARPFWLGAVGAGHLLPLALLLLLPSWGVVAALLALFGLVLYEHLFIVAGQAIPLS